MTNGAGSGGALNPWASAWRKPRATILDLLWRKDRRGLFLLAAASGATLLLEALQSHYLHWLATLTMGLVFAPLVGLLQLWLSGALGAWAGRRLGGHASAADVRLAFAWSWLPYALSAALLAAGVVVFRQDVLSPPVQMPMALLTIALSLASFVMAVRMIGAIQDFGLLRSVANVMAPTIIVAVLALLVRVLLYQPFSIPAGSMQPALLVGDLVYADKLAYGLSRHSFPFALSFNGRFWPAEPRRGDIAIFASPDGTGTVYAKRIVGLPGETVEMKRGVLIIDGSEVARASAGSFETRAAGGGLQSAPAFRETLPGGFTYTVLDSEIDGPLDTVGPFQVPAGSYFVLGDHRDNSLDSRSREFGFVPFDNLIGRVAVVYFSADEVARDVPASAAFDNVRWHRIGFRPH